MDGPPTAEPCPRDPTCGRASAGHAASPTIVALRPRSPVRVNPSAYTAFGLELAPELSLPGLAVGPPPGRAALAIRLTGVEALRQAWSGAGDAPAWSTRFSDGCFFHVEVGARRDHLMTYEGHAEFLLSSDRRELLCAPRAEHDPAWQRQLMDTVLWFTCVLSGLEVLHAGAVELPGGIVAVVAESGGGKTTLVTELVRRGAGFFTDDVLALEPSDDDGPLAHPGPALANLPLTALADAGGLVERVLATFPQDAEAWVSLRRVESGPRPVSAVILMARRPGLETSVTTLSPSPLPLLPHVPCLGPDRWRSRFEVVSSLAARAPVLRLEAAPEVPPAVLAELVERAVVAERMVTA